jgi:N-dimethylarginine dimethylaminohydrolase
MVRSEGDRLRQAVVCTPRVEYARGACDLEKHNIGELSRPEIAIQQHDRLKAAITAFGAEVLDIPEMADHPNSVFTRDTGLCTPQGYIELRRG